MRSHRQTPISLFLQVLLIVFVAEAGVMFILPSLLSQRVPSAVQGLVDSCLLTVVSAPLLWWSIIEPLRRLAVVERAKAEALGAASREGVVTFNDRGTIESFSPGAEHIFGFASHEIVGDDLGTLIPWQFLARQPDPSTEGSARARLLEGTVKISGRRKDGSEVPLALSISEVCLGSHPLYTAVMRDLVDRERDEMRAEQMAAVAQLGTAFAHRLRNPLTSIKMLIQAGRRHEGAVPLDPDDMRVMEEEVRRMERSVQMFLDFARPRRLELRGLSISPLVSRAIAAVRARAERKRIVIRFSCGEEISEMNGDEEQLHQAITHVLQNAVEAVLGEGSVDVELRQAESGEIELQIVDSGPGISPDVLPRLFQPFVTTKATGVGLGLVISRRIVEAHGGSLTAHNRPQGGAAFAVRLSSAATASGDAGPTARGH